eukprot:5246439-Amphidinium_carterae.1
MLHDKQIPDGYFEPASIHNGKELHVIMVLDSIRCLRFRERCDNTQIFLRTVFLVLELTDLKPS